MKFPVKIVKGESEYFAKDQDVLDFHLTQGWSVADGQETEEEDAPEDLGELVTAVDKRFTAVEGEMQAQGAQIDALNKSVTALEDELKALNELVATLVTAPSEPPPVTEPAPPADK